MNIHTVNHAIGVELVFIQASRFGNVMSFLYLFVLFAESLKRYPGRGGTGAGWPTKLFIEVRNSQLRGRSISTTYFVNRNFADSATDDKLSWGVISSPSTTCH
jgi:hypothetical protein